MKLSEIKEFVEKIEPYEIEGLKEAKIEEIAEFNTTMRTF